MPPNDNWKVTILRDRESENSWVATAKRDDFEHTQKVQGNEGEITEFCKTARNMYRQHLIDKARSVELETHFDEILEREDKREADEAAAASAKAAADMLAAEQAAKEAEVAAAQAAADAALPPPEPVVEAPAEPIQDAATSEDKNETPV